MKNKLKMISVTLALVLALCVCFVACNKTKTDPAKERADAVASVENAFMSGVVDGWTNSLDEQSLKDREDAGDYIVTLGWTKMICSVVSESDLQTAKIKSLANALSSQNGKTLLGDFEKNAELLIPLLKEVGFTPSDVSAIVYDLTCAMVTKGYKTICDVYNELIDLEQYMRQNAISGKPLDNVVKNRLSISIAKSDFVTTDAEKSQMLTAFSNARNALARLVSFAYNMSVNAITDDLYGKLFDDSGALGEITDGEIETLVDTLLLNVQDLKDALGQNEVSALNSALDLVIDKFDKKTVSSAIYAQIVKYAKYAYMVVDVIPTICDVVTSSGNLLSSEDFIKDFLSASQNGDNLDTATNLINQSILVSRAILNLTSEGGYDAQKLLNIVDEIVSANTGEYQKAVPLFTLDLMFNFSSLYDSITGGDDTDLWQVVHSDVMTQDALGTQVSLVFFFDGGFDNFKETYYKYTRGDATQAQLRSAFDRCSFGSFIENERIFRTDELYTSDWYDYYVTIGLNAVNQKVSNVLKNNVSLDIKAFVGDYFSENSEMKAAIQTLAQMSILTQNIGEEDIANVYIPLLSKSRVLGATILFMSQAD